ncbi:hypothetical protein NHX12_009269 [Muraenolepis orangiensis]|uniref:Uncharacterized protein n=1 Tax=Muraenolepis orangiensis TaxID=630683 RepID=A0A9Q0DN18_9TELE|nr:hypothetical protein NHX12_009269 [Muraenolepis orangiensis]
MLMMCVEWWTFEIGSFLAGIIGEAELGAQSVMYQIVNIGYMFPLAFSIAGSVRVGNNLGTGDTEQAKLSAKMAILCAGVFSCCVAVIMGSLKEHLSYMFTYDEEIRQRVADTTSGGVIRGAGLQRVGAVYTFLGYYGAGLPIGVSLMFAAKLGIKGLWMGLLICIALQFCFLVVYLGRMDWRKVTVEAQIRAGVYRNLVIQTTRWAGLWTSAAQCLLPETGAAPAPGAAMLAVLATGIIVNLLITPLVK